MMNLLKILFFLPAVLMAQNNALVLNGAFIVMNGGSFNENVQLVVNQADQSGIQRNSGHIVTESQYNYINWKTGASTGTYLFPTGYANSDYLPVTLEKISSGASEIKVSTWATPTNNLPFADSSSVAACTNMNSIYGGTANGTVVDRWWDVVTSTATTADVTFTYRGVENTTTNPTAMLNAQRWNGGQWLLPQGMAPGVSSGVGSLTAFGITEFSPFVLVNSGGLLPVELINFTGFCIGAKISLEWTTASETNNAFFTIERSDNSIDWQVVTHISGAGNSNNLINYEYIDENVLRNTNMVYYRIKQTDHDGKYKYYNPIGVSVCDESVDLTVFPNPVIDFVTIRTNDVNVSYDLNLKSADGKSIFNNLKMSGNENTLDLSALSAGMYFLCIYNSGTGKLETKKIVKQ